MALELQDIVWAKTHIWCVGVNISNCVTEIVSYWILSEINLGTDSSQANKSGGSQVQYFEEQSIEEQAEA